MNLSRQTETKEDVHILSTYFHKLSAFIPQVISI